MKEPLILVIPMRADHIDAVVHAHLESFRGFFTSFLGPKFMKLFYLEVLKTPEHVAAVAVDDCETIIGFAVGVSHQTRFYANLIRRRWFMFAVASLQAIVRRPSIIPRIVRALTYPRNSQTASSQAILMSLAVVPGVQANGVGGLLVKHFLSVMQQKNITSISLTTDQNDNERTNGFYEKLGFKVVRTYVTPEGRCMNEYIIEMATWAPLLTEK